MNENERARAWLHENAPKYVQAYLGELRDKKINKPQWEDAPDWANYLTKDDDGTRAWFENEPFRDWTTSGRTFYPRGGKHAEIPNTQLIPFTTIEERPL